MDLNHVLRDLLPSIANISIMPDAGAGPAANMSEGRPARMEPGIERLLLPLLGGMHATNPLLRTLMVANQAAGAYLGIDPTLLVTGMGVVWAANRLVRQFVSLVWHGLVLRYLTASVSVSSDDEIFSHVMAWLAAQPRTGRARALIAETIDQTAWEEELAAPAGIDLQAARYLVNGMDSYLNFSNQKARKVPRYIPALGLHDFWFRRRYFMLNRRKQPVLVEGAGLGGTSTVSDRENMVISCFGFSPEPIKEFLSHVREHYFKDHYAKTVIKRPSNAMARRFGRSHWALVANRPVRPLHTVVLDHAQKSQVLSDMNEYLHPLAPQWYASRGIPLRRGYLLHGPPGTGKTSLSFALAGVFGLDIFVISLLDPQLTEEDLLHLFNSLPRRCLVLLEDIDAAGLTRPDEGLEQARPGRRRGGGRAAAAAAASTTEAEGQPSDGPGDWKISDLARALKSNNGAGDPEKRGISLSGLLNAIDGVASQEGRVLVMTTNRPETLDDALIRPGRIDLQIAFSNATQEQAAELFQRMYDVDETDQSTTAVGTADAKELQPLLDTGDAFAGQDSEDKIRDAEELARISVEFGSKIPECQLSPAEIQGFLLKRRKYPRKALLEVDGWVKAMSEQKETKSKVLQVQ